MPRTVLILDDEPKITALLQRSLAREGYEVLCESNPLAALERLKERPIDVLLTDIKMPEMDGLEVLRRAKSIRPACEVIVMTAYASVETAREALKRGAIDYLTKPFSADEDLKPLLAKVFDSEQEPSRLATPASSHPASLPAAHGPAASHSRSAASAGSSTGEIVGRIIAQSSGMQKILDRLPRIAASNASILLRGESGTGKEVLADAIHALSSRAGKPLIKVNCGALPENLLESELFGHVRGSFTGAVSDREGRFEAADGGTLMLDEIGEVSPALQVKLLRVLQEGEFQRVGESRTRRVDVRVLAATNRDLEAMMRQGIFRQDLFYRLNVVPILLPPLRERREDIPALIEHFAHRLAPDRAVHFSPEAMKAILAYGWPGNIRELENAVEHALVLGEPDQIRLEDLPVALQDAQARQNAAPGPLGGAATLEDIERHCLLAALKKTQCNQTRAARLLGVTRRTLGYRIRKYNLEEEMEKIRAESAGRENSAAGEPPVDAERKV